MKKDIHPATYRPVVFFDTQANMKFLTRSTIETNETIQWEDGETYPLAKVDISSASHPYYTGKKIFIMKDPIWYCYQMLSNVLQNSQEI